MNHFKRQEQTENFLADVSQADGPHDATGKTRGPDFEPVFPPSRADQPVFGLNVEGKRQDKSHDTRSHGPADTVRSDGQNYIAVC